MTPAVRRLALGSGFVDRPTARRFHARPVPLGGGIAIVLGVVPAAWVGGLGAAPPLTTTTLIAGLALVFALGLVDDRRGMHPLIKLTGQVLAAGLMVWGSRLPAAGGAGTLTIGLGVAWAVGLMNACNFLDNMDGILAGIAALCGLAFWGLAAGGGGAPVLALAAAVAGGSIGFLIHNFAPARIFMGDAGSMALGYLLAAISIALVGGGPAAPRWGSLLPVALVLGYPIFDITFVTITRMLDRRKIYLGGRDHSSHRLNRILMNPRLTALAVYLCTGMVAGLGVALGRHPSLSGWLGAAAAVVLLALGLRLARVPIR